MSKFGRLDVAVNHVGGPAPSDKGRLAAGNFLDYPESGWDGTFLMNVKTAYYGCQAEARVFLEQDVLGSIINVTSKSGIGVADGNAAHGAAKAAVHHMTQTLAFELGRFGIRMNALALGNHPRTSRAELMGPEWVRTQAHATALFRNGDPMTSAGVTVFLASKLSGFVTGQVVTSDGGALLGFRRPRRDDVPELARRLGRIPRDEQ